METLFSNEPVLPPGFSYFTDFLSQVEEQQLLQEISGIEFRRFEFQGYEAKRRVASFGYDYSFDKKTISKSRDIPVAFDPLIAKVASRTGIQKEMFVELLVTEYPPGSVINWHRDAFPFGLIAGVSLLSQCTFRLRPHDKARQNRRSVVSVHIARRSLYILDGPARTDWQHSTAPVKGMRYSITLRTLRRHHMKAP